MKIMGLETVLASLRKIPFVLNREASNEAQNAYQRSLRGFVSPDVAVELSEYGEKDIPLSPESYINIKYLTGEEVEFTEVFLEKNEEKA
jgi:hypothetical protein